MVGDGMAEAVRFGRKPDRTDIAGFPLDHQPTHRMLAVHRHRNHAVVEREAHRLPPIAHRRPDRQSRVRHARLEARHAAVVIAFEVCAHFGRECQCQVGMARGAMVALPRILHHQLPVALFQKHHLAREFGMPQIMRRQQRRQAVGERIERRRNLGKAGIQGAGNVADMDRQQRMLGAVETVLHAARADQPAAQVIRPLVVGADQDRPLTSAGRADHRAAMPARIVEAAYLAGPVAHDHDRGLAHGQRECRARLRQFAFQADKHPGTPEDRYQIEAERFVGSVESLRQGVSGASGLQQPAHRAEILLHHPHRHLHGQGPRPAM